ncbi:hypothetical protein ACERIT_00020 [Halopenitus sp. H-Gu1]|uniref:DUF7097 family protein n=1 Tax=Halopenitus sp. H-Gu1 TaxID=3242697 RepID=UPI00359EE3B4
MERTPSGTPVGVDDPYAVAGVCDHLTDDGRCRYALEGAGDDSGFIADRRRDEYACHVGEEDRWCLCPHYRSTTNGRDCRRCGLQEIRLPHEDARPLLEEHHLRYADATGTDRSEDGADAGSHEITVSLCRWCHAKVHGSFARIDDDANPDPEAIAERERRRSAELSEFGFDTARDRYADGGE